MTREQRVLVLQDKLIRLGLLTAGKENRFICLDYWCRVALGEIVHAPTYYNSCSDDRIKAIRECNRCSKRCGR